MTLAQQCKALKILKDHYETAKAEKEAREREYKEAQVALIERMESEGTDSLRTGGILFVPTETQYGNIQDRGAFVEWARAHDDSLVEQRERKELLNQLVRERLDNGEELPPGVGFYVRQYVSQRSA